MKMNKKFNALQRYNIADRNTHSLEYVVHTQRGAGTYLLTSKNSARTKNNNNSNNRFTRSIGFPNIIAQYENTFFF